MIAVRIPILICTVALGTLMLSGGEGAPSAATAVEPSTTAPAAPFRLSGLRMPSRVVGQRGRARILVGVRMNRAARLTIQISEHPTGTLRRSYSDEKLRTRGRAFALLSAVNDRGFQLTPGVYRIAITAQDARGNISNELGKTFRLRLTPPRGIFDVYTVPLLPAFRRPETKGAVVAVVAPGGPAAKAGIRRGDVITKIGPHWITTPGTLDRAKRALLGRRTITVRVRRSGELRALRMTPAPNWVSRRPYGPSLAVAARRAPDDYAIAYARISQLIDRGELELAAQVLAGLRRSWRLAAPAQFLQGRILQAQGRRKPALGAFIRATARDPQFVDALIAQGALLGSAGARARAIAAFQQAETADPHSAVAPAFEAYMHIATETFPAARVAADRALTRDLLYADAHVTRGLALLAEGEKASGLQALRRGVLDLPDQSRANQLLAQVERYDP